MRPALRPAGLGLALMFALGSFGASSAFAQDDAGEGKAITLSDLESQSGQSEEFRRLAEQKRLESIDRLKGLLRDAPEGDRKAEMMLRLADLYYEQGKGLYFEEMERFQKEYDACFNAAENADECDSIKADHGDSFAWYGGAIKLYKNIQSNFPRYARVDQATYYLGMTYKEMEKPDAALNEFKRLVKLYGDSSFAPDAYLLIGDHYFDDNQAFPALQAYKRAVAYNDSPRYSYAMYKLAWSFYNVEEYGKAIDTMKAVVAWSMENDTGETRAIKLEDEALKDLVRFFADAGEMDEAYAYFTKLGKKDLILAMLKRLASLYFEQGKFDQSVETYRRLIAEQPSSPANPGYQEEIISAYRKMGQKDRVLDEIRRLRTDYGRTSAWWRSNASDPKSQTEADNTIEKALRKTATDFNKEARDLKKARHPRATEAFESAIEAYYVYLEDYSKHSNAYNVHYDFGELLYMLKRYEEAYKEYMTVVDIDPNGQHSRFCAESAIFAAEEMVKAEGGNAPAPKGIKIPKDTPPTPLTEWEQRLVDACARYAKLYPKDSKVEVAIYKAAFLLYQRFHFADAAALFRDVIAMNPKSQNAEYSANLILDALTIREEWVPLRDTAKAFYNQENLGSSKFKKEMYGIYSAASFTVIEKDFEKNQDYAKTADAYLAFYEEFPEYEKVAIALNNASVYYTKIDRVVDSMAVRHILVEDEKFGPKTKYYFTQIGELGADYERLADFENAAKYFDLLLSVYDDEKKKAEKAKATDEQLATMDATAADALYTSAIFRNALGDWEGAISRYRDFMARFPSDDRVTDIRLVIGRLYEEHEAWEDAEDVYAAFYTKDAKDAAPEFTYFARLHHGRALIAQGKVSDGRKVYRSSIEAHASAVKKGLEPGAHTEFVAEMMYEETKPQFEAYAAIDVDAGSERNRRKVDKLLKKLLTDKTKSLVELEKAYAAIIETGSGAWGLASLVDLGRAYEEMADTLKDSPCPFYLTEDQCEIYKMTLEDRAYPQVEKAVEAYRLSLAKAYELNLYNDTAAFATRRLGELRPEDYPGLLEEVPEPGLTSDKVRTFDVETSL